MSHREALQNVALSILGSQRPAHSLRGEVSELVKILAASGKFQNADSTVRAVGETETPNGLALSPSMAATCADDFVRTVEFIRGTHAAIMDIRKRNPLQAAHVLYVGCGPYAPLIIPLMTIFSSQEAIFTLLDIHPESIESAQCVVDALGLNDHLAYCETMDAISYHVDPEHAPDIILIETMQACLEVEPQVALTRHLLTQAPNAILIPEEVRVELVWVDPSREFGTSLDNLQDRIPVASAFTVNRDTVHSWTNIPGNHLPGADVQLPDPLESRYQLMLFTIVQVYREHMLKDYDSGLTSPRQFSGDRPVKVGDTIHFHYELGRQPRLIGKIST